MPNRLRFFTFFGARKQVPHRFVFALPIVLHTFLYRRFLLRQSRSVHCRTHSDASLPSFPGLPCRFRPAPEGSLVACDRSAKKLYIFHTASPVSPSFAVAVRLIMRFARLLFRCRCHTPRSRRLDIFSPAIQNPPYGSRFAAIRGISLFACFYRLCAPAQQYATQD